jgi:hypothetical protein
MPEEPAAPATPAPPAPPAQPPQPGVKSPQEDELENLFDDSDETGSIPAPAGPTTVVAEKPVAAPAEPAADSGTAEPADTASDTSASEAPEMVEATATSEPALSEPAPAQPQTPARPAEDDFDNLFEEEPSTDATPAGAAPAASVADDSEPSLLADEEEATLATDPIPADEPVADDDAMLDESAANATSPTNEGVAAYDVADAETSGDQSVRDVIAAKPSEAGAMRLWTDNTGKFQVRARLVQVLDGKVRLEKESGRFTTVPMDRLSRPDLAFLRSQAPTVASASMGGGAEF